MADKRFVRSVQDLINSTISFHEAPEYWREAVGTNPRYFLHYYFKGKHFFGLSKFCAFKNMNLQDYVVKYRHTTNGAITQKHIRRVVGSDWVPYLGSSFSVRRAFDSWVNSFFSAYNQKGASFINLDSYAKKGPKIRFPARNISPEKLANDLKNQTKVGKVGELIAYKYELRRLEKLGVRGPHRYVDHVSKRNAAAGFDIWSRYSKKSARFIEVKSTKTGLGEFYITENEIKTLRKHGDKAFIYRVHVTDVKRKRGKVMQEIQNPIKDLKLHPVLFKAELIRRESSPRDK